MGTLEPYRLHVLVSAQASPDERNTLQSLLAEWAREHGGSFSVLASEEGRRLAYPVKKHGQATVFQFSLAAPADDIRELPRRLSREASVLRVRVFRGALLPGKRVKDIPLRRPEAGDRKAVDLPTVPVKPKVPIEKLEEKIDEILKEEVL